MSTDANVDALYRVWRSGDDLLLVIADVGEIELTRDEALALAAELQSSFDITTKKPAHYKRWTAAEHEELRRLYVDERVSPAEIARRLGRNRMTVSSLISRAGYAAHNKTRSERAKRMWTARPAA